jgi:U3 small nucleolar RNA-associated protein 10
MQSLVTSYSSYLLEPMKRVLEDDIKADEDEMYLRQILIDALSKSFEYDEDDFWQTPDHFTTITAPLVNQLTTEFEKIISEHVIPAITLLARAVQSTDLRKELNIMLMKYLRDPRARTRLAAVKCQQSITNQLGEDWLSLLPEMLPYISELQEDDDEIVEMETQRWIKSIEDILGESLDTMLQ